MTANSPFLLVTPPVPSTTFSAVEPFAAFLEAAEDDTETVPVDSAAAVLLDRDGRTVGDGYRYTGWAFGQACKLLCPGLARVVQSLADGDSPERAAAVATFNRLVGLRYETCLSGCQMLLGTRTKTVEGVMGVGYRRVSNQRLASLLAENVPGGSRFLTATAAGRWVLVRYVSPGAYGGTDFGWRQGWHVAAHDAGGASVRVTAALVRATDRTTVLVPPGRKRVRHVGDAFEARLTAAFERAADGLKPAAVYAAAVAARGAPLSPPDHTGAIATKLSALVGRLVEAGVGRMTAGKAVRRAALYGSSRSPVADELVGLTRAVWATRTELDLVAALCRAARSLAVPARERVEVAAYRILTGETSIGD